MKWIEFVSKLQNDDSFEEILGVAKSEFELLHGYFLDFKDKTKRKGWSSEHKLYAILVHRKYGLNDSQMGKLVLESQNAKRDGQIFIKNLNARLEDSLKSAPVNLQGKISGFVQPSDSGNVRDLKDIIDLSKTQTAVHHVNEPTVRIDHPIPTQHENPIDLPVRTPIDLVSHNSLSRSPDSCNAAVQDFLGDGSSGNPSHLEFKTWYNPDVCHYLLQMSDNKAKCIRVLFLDAGYGNNTKTFNDQLQTLIVLGNAMNKNAIFISKEPGADNHFVCGLVHRNQLLLVNPLGITTHYDCYQTLAELRQRNILDQVWFSSQTLQKKGDAGEGDGTYSCGPISIELATRILEDTTDEQLNQFWDRLQATEPTTHHATHFVYFGTQITSLLPKTLVALLESTNQSDYQQQILDLRQKHLAQLRKLPGLLAKSQRCSVANYLEKCKVEAPAQVVFNALLMGDKTADRVMELDEYKLLEEEFKSPVQTQMQTNSRVFVRPVEALDTTGLGDTYVLEDTNIQKISENGIKNKGVSEGSTKKIIMSMAPVIISYRDEAKGGGAFYDHCAIQNATKRNTTISLPQGYNLLLALNEELPKSLDEEHTPAIIKSGKYFEIIIKASDGTIKKIKDPAGPAGMESDELERFFKRLEGFFRNQKYGRSFLLFNDKIIQWIREVGHTPLPSDWNITALTSYLQKEVRSLPKGIVSPVEKAGELSSGLLLIPGRARETESKRGETHRQRSKHEEELLHLALLRGQPILSICAGSWSLWKALCALESLVGNTKDVDNHNYGAGMPRILSNYTVGYNKQIHRIKIEPDECNRVLILPEGGNIPPTVSLGTIILQKSGVQVLAFWALDTKIITKTLREDVCTQRIQIDLNDWRDGREITRNVNRDLVERTILLFGYIQPSTMLFQAMGYSFPLYLVLGTEVRQPLENNHFPTLVKVSEENFDLITTNIQRNVIRVALSNVQDAPNWNEFFTKHKKLGKIFLNKGDEAHDKIRLWIEREGHVYHHSTSPQVNSVHWQAVDDGTLPKNARICARAIRDDSIAPQSRQTGTMVVEDRSVEAFETCHGAPVLGIQWHPEAYNPGEVASQTYQPDKHQNLLLFMAKAGDSYFWKRKLLSEYDREVMLMENNDDIKPHAINKKR